MNKQVTQAVLKDEAYEIRQLRAIYDKALTDIQENIRIQDERINILVKDIDSLTDEQKSELQSAIYQKKYQQSIQQQLEKYVNDLGANAYDNIDDYMKKCYETSWIGNMYDLHKQGIPMAIPIDQKKVADAMTLNSKLSSSLLHRMGVDMGILKKKVANNLARGIASGASWSNIARQLQLSTTESFNTAMRIARTEGHRVNINAQVDAMNAAKDNGADIVKQWDAALDSKVRPVHRELDGQIRELDEPFECSIGEVQAPSRFGIAAQDINCRCIINQRARWALDEEELQILKDRAEALGLDKSQQFEDFKKQFLNKTAETNTSKTVPKFTPAKTIEEAEEYVKQFVDESTWGGTGVSYKGIGLDAANAINEALTKLFGDYNLGKLGGVVAPAGNTKLGKAIANAKAAYSPVRKSLLINRKVFKSIEAAVKSALEDQKLIDAYIKNPEAFVFKSKRVERIVKASVESGRATVPETIEDIINHEFGHMFEHLLSNKSTYPQIVKNMPKYAPKISGYATDDIGEYIAESFASYRKGEGLIDPELKKLFDEMKISNTSSYAGTLKSIVKINNSDIINVEKYIGKPISAFGNQEVREWYWSNVHNIQNEIDRTKSLEEQTRQAFELRNKYKREARLAMADKETADCLDDKRPVKSFEELLESKMKRKNMTREEALRDMLETASTTNSVVDKQFGL